MTMRAIGLGGRLNPGNYPWWDNIYIRAMLALCCRKAREARSRAALERMG
ncbi:MAG: hypothetical protein KGL45_00690 [Gammaproteobacteria bacterium]|nr:hypothetical protein [Gammaproteobacteria bacterium]MDE2261019.1 hypothetical protein [Gammaproteobacteria bacterium]